jgi:RNA polymerase sigma-70 factor (ECF subfamily)
METTERQLSVQNAINALPEYQRAMVIMYHAENMSYEEISAALDLPLGTVKSRLNRARLNLRELLVKNEELFKQY